MRRKINFILAAIAVMSIVFLSALSALIENGTSVDSNGKNLAIQILVLLISGLFCVKLYRNKSFQKFLKRSHSGDVEMK